MSEVYCSKCGNPLLKELSWEEYIKRYPTEKFIQCPFCGEIMEIKNED